MQRNTIGVDIGGTKIQAGLVSTNNKIISSQRFPMDRGNRKKAVQSIIKSIQPFFSKNIRAIGIGITGQVEIRTGIVQYSPNLPKDWKNVPLKKILTKKFGVPVFIDNDAHCIALAEAVFGVAKNYPVVLGMTIGTGIGTALIINKKVYRGADNVIEFGHTIVGDGGVRCSCGLNDHFEAFVSGPAMTRRYKELTGLTKTPLEIEKSLNKGDLPAKKVFIEMSTILAKGIADAIHSYNPSIVVLGGGLGKVHQLTYPAIKKIRDFIKYPALLKTKVTTSQLKYSAGVLGASLITKIKY